MKNECADCRDAERETDGATTLKVVRLPDSGRMVKRAYLCQEHIEMYSSDGYKVEAA